MDIENNIHLANDVSDDTQQISITDATNCFEVNYKKDNFKSNSEKHAAVWTTKDISTLLKIYEDKLVMLKTPNMMKTMIWIVISKCLKRYNLEVTPDQVRRKINALTNRYKRCLNCGQHERFRYFKEMHKICAKFNVNTDDNTEMAQRKQSCYNIKLISKFNRKKSKKCQESKAIIQLRKKPLSKKIEFDRSQSKICLEKQWLEYVKRQEEQKLSKDENLEKKVKVKEEEVELRKETFKISESFDYRKMQMWERKHETLLRIEIEKFEMLKKMSSLQK